LDVFTSAGEIDTKTVLVDTASGEGLYQHIAAYSGVFIFSTTRGINVGLSEFEFFAVDNTSGEDVFRATRFRQFKRSGEEAAGTGGDILWEDLDMGIVYESGVAISGKQIPWKDGRRQISDGRCRFEYPSEFHVEQRPRTVIEFDDIVRALRALFDASVKTDNPVRWSC
jgi:hypothetical protein